MIPHSRPAIGEAEADAVRKVLERGQLSQDTEVAALEDELALFLGLKGAVALASGSAALHLALQVLGVRQGDEVVIPSYVCSALLNAVNYCAATPMLCDVDINLGNLDVRDCRRRISEKSKTVIIPHMFGSCFDLQPFIDTGLPLIEDCAQSIGAENKGYKAGSRGNIAVFSFYATKVICAGEGGALASDDESLLEAVRDLRDYDHKPEYKIRFNYKMTEIQAAIARVQLRRLPHFVTRRREIARKFSLAASQAGLKTPVRESGDIFYRYIVYSDDIEGMMEYFRRKNITAAKPVFRPLHRYLNLPGFPGAEEIYRKALSIPCYPALTDVEVEEICQALESIS